MDKNGDGTENNSIALGAPKLAGFSFQGWQISVSVNGKVQSVSGEDIANYLNVEANNTFTLNTDFISTYIDTYLADELAGGEITITFTATWKDITYTIEYKAVNGEGEDSTHCTLPSFDNNDYTMKDPTQNVVTLIDPEVAIGYKFEGWFTDKACTEGNKAKASYTAKELYDTFEDHKATFYAKVVAITVTVIFKDGEEEVKQLETTADIGYAVGGEDIAPEEKTFYRFARWEEKETSREATASNAEIVSAIKYLVEEHRKATEDITIEFEAQWLQAVALYSEDKLVVEIDHSDEDTVDSLKAAVKAALDKKLIYNLATKEHLAFENEFNVEVETSNFTKVIGNTYQVKFTLTLINAGERSYFLTNDIEAAQGAGEGSLTSTEIVFKYKTVEVDGTLYTIEDALAKANSGKAVVKYNTSFASESVAKLAGYYNVVDDKQVPNSDYYTVKAGVTLLIPGYESDEGTLEVNDEVGFEPVQHPDGDNEGGYCALVVADNITLTVKGIMTISARRSSTNRFTSIVHGNDYGKVELKDGSKLNLESGSEFNAMGFIYGKGTIEAKGSTDEDHPGAKVTETFSLPGWKGGSQVLTYMLDTALKSCAPYDVPFPVSQYAFNSIISTIKFNYGSSYIVYATATAALSENSEQVHVSMGISFMSDKQESFIQLEKGSYMVKSINETNGKIHLETHGNLTFNNLILSMEDPIMHTGQTFSISTSDTGLPIPGNFALSVVGGTATVPDKVKFKLLPGSTLTVAKDAEIIFESGSALYAYGKDNYSMKKAYFKVESSFGGDGSGSKVDITEMEDVYEFRDGKSFTYPINTTLNGKQATIENTYYNAPTLDYNSDSEAVITVKGKITARSGSKIGATFRGEDKAILDLSESDIALKEVKTLEIFDGRYYIITTLTGKAIHEDEGSSDLFMGKWTYTDGRWTSPHKITYKFMERDTSGSPKPYTGKVEGNKNPTSFNTDGKDITLVAPTFDIGYYLEGWYDDEACTNMIENNVLSVSQYTTDIIIYGVVTPPNNDDMYTITYDLTQLKPYFDSGIISSMMYKNIHGKEDRIDRASLMGGWTPEKDSEATAQGTTKGGWLNRLITAINDNEYGSWKIPAYAIGWSLSQSEYVPFTYEKLAELYHGGETVNVYLYCVEKHTHINISGNITLYYTKQKYFYNSDDAIRNGINDLSQSTRASAVSPGDYKMKMDVYYGTPSEIENWNINHSDTAETYQKNKLNLDEVTIYDKATTNATAGAIDPTPIGTTLKVIFTTYPSDHPEGIKEIWLYVYDGTNTPIVKDKTLKQIFGRSVEKEIEIVDGKGRLDVEVLIDYYEQPEPDSEKHTQVNIKSNLKLDTEFDYLYNSDDAIADGKNDLSRIVRTLAVLGSKNEATYYFGKQSEIDNWNKNVVETAEAYQKNKLILDNVIIMDDTYSGDALPPIGTTLKVIFTTYPSDHPEGIQEELVYTYDGENTPLQKGKTLKELFGSSVEKEIEILEGKGKLDVEISVTFASPSQPDA